MLDTCGPKNDVTKLTCDVTTMFVFSQPLNQMNMCHGIALVCVCSGKGGGGRVGWGGVDNNETSNNE